MFFINLITYIHQLFDYFISGVPKLEGKVQCTGEAQYTDDFPKQPGELVAAMVQAKQARCELDTVDTSAALVRNTLGVKVRNMKMDLTLEALNVVSGNVH